MAARLIVADGPARGELLELTADTPRLIGRGTEAQWQIADPRISRRQCQVELQGSQLLVTDLGSSGGTQVNGGRIARPTLIPHGATIRIGETTLRFEADLTAASTIITPPANAAPAEDVRLEQLVGKTLHSYEVREELARGQTGMIFKAWDSAKSRDLALKVLWPELSQEEEQMERFLRGMKSMYPVRHPHIVRIYNAGITAAGEVLPPKLAWVAMEYVDGRSLTAVIREIGISGMLDWKVGFHVALQIARALEAAYDQKIIHRNITPQNILYNARTNTAKLTDLMWAKALEGAQSKEVTTGGKVVGDLAYLPLERLTGDTSQIDCRSDIYGLGATVYALLTGRPPFESKSLPELIVKIRNEAPEKLKKYQLSIPDLFEGVILRMLAKRPDDRYQTPSAVVKDLERVGKFQGIDV